MTSKNKIISVFESSILVEQCCCCGGYAGKWEQWRNRDTGYGICRKCSDWIAERWPDENQNDLYGLPGVKKSKDALLNDAIPQTVKTS